MTRSTIVQLQASHCIELSIASHIMLTSFMLLHIVQRDRASHKLKQFHSSLNAGESFEKETRGMFDKVAYLFTLLQNIPGPLRTSKHVLPPMVCVHRKMWMAYYCTTKGKNNVWFGVRHFIASRHFSFVLFAREKMPCGTANGKARPT